MVIDSFRTKVGTKTVPVAAAYLDLLGVSSLDSVIVTHWHEDHSAGAGDLVRRYKETLRLVGLPSGWGSRELASFLYDMMPNSNRARYVKDIVDVLEALKEPPAGTERVLLSNRVELAPFQGKWRLTALSPSHEDERQHVATLGQLASGSAHRAFDVNSGSAVLRLEANRVIAVFGSDLDLGPQGDEKRGWRAVMKHHAAQLGSDLVKVAHHGSETAFHADIWDLFAKEMGKPLAVVTPFPARGEPLPREQEVRRIKKHSSQLHLSGIRSRNRGRKQGKAGAVPISRTPFSTYTNTSPVGFEQVGHVRYRFGPNGARSVDAFAPAHQL